MTIIQLIIIISSVILALVLLVVFIVIIEALVRQHYLPTSTTVLDRVQTIISEHIPHGGIVYDLGCGHGLFALSIQKENPTRSVRGIDTSYIRIWFAKVYTYLIGRHVIFTRKNIFNADLRDADIVYTYLWYSVMPPLEQKLRKELKPGAIVITNTSYFPNWKPIRTIITHQVPCATPDFETLFIYRQDT